jgi:hypothetical protein
MRGTFSLNLNFNHLDANRPGELNNHIVVVGYQSVARNLTIS